MAILKKNAFSRRVPDLVTEELVAVLSRRASFEFTRPQRRERWRGNAASACLRKIAKSGCAWRRQKEWQEVQRPAFRTSQRDRAAKRPHSRNRCQVIVGAQRGQHAARLSSGPVTDHRRGRFRQLGFDRQRPSGEGWTPQSDQR